MKKSALVFPIILVMAVLCALYTITHLERIDVGHVGVVYSMSSGVQDEVLQQGYHFVSPFQHVKEFTIGNEQLILTKDKREGSRDDESFRVATSDDASIAVSFQMSYRFIPERVVETYKKFRGLDGQDIVEQRVRTVLKSKVSEITTDYSLMDIYSGNRSEINNKLTEYLNQEFVKAFGIEVLDCSIIDAHPDDKLKKAINNRIEALQAAQKAEAEQKKIKVEAETKVIEAEADKRVKIAKAEAEAEATKIDAEAQAEANKKLASSITKELIEMKEAEARLKHGWVTVQGADTVVTK